MLVDRECHLRRVPQSLTLPQMYAWSLQVMSSRLTKQILRTDKCQLQEGLRCSYVICNVTHEMRALCQWVQHRNKNEEVADEFGVTLFRVMETTSKETYV